ncbi:hypothetical protein D3C86_1802160 [compost metagenome]
MVKLARIRPFEHLNGNIKSSVQLAVEILHHCQSNGLVRNAWYDYAFEHMGKRAMPKVMQENRRLRTFLLRLPDHMPLFLQSPQSLTHEVHRSKRVVKTCVKSAGINDIGQAELPDAP